MSDKIGEAPADDTGDEDLVDRVRENFLTRDTLLFRWRPIHIFEQMTPEQRRGVLGLLQTMNLDAFPPPLKRRR